MVPLFSLPIYRRYFAHRFSVAYIFSWLCSCLVVIIPFLLSFSPDHTRGNSTEGGLWTKNKLYREQPQLHYSRDIILVAHVLEDSSISQSPKEIFFSTVSVLNELHPTSFRMASLKSREIDNNFDGIVDTIDIKILLPLQTGESVHGIQVIPFFDMILNNHVKMKMETLAYIHYASGIPITTFATKGELVLEQKALFSIRKSQSILYTDSRLLDKTLTCCGNKSSIQHMVDEVDARLISTNYIQRYPTTSFVSREQALNISMIFHNPAQNIAYTPAVYELVVDAWIRYFSLYWIAIKLVHRLNSFVFPNRIIETFEMTDMIRVKKYN